MKSSSKLRALRYFSILAFQLFSIFPLAAILDTNTNGMSDLWEKQYNNGELFPSSFLPAADPDLDGWDNLTEAAAGTDPHNANSPNGHIRITLQPTSAPGLFHLTHPTILGKNYQLQGSYDLAQWYNISDAHLALENQHTTITGASLTGMTQPTAEAKPIGLLTKLVEASLRNGAQHRRISFPSYSSERAKTNSAH